MPRVIRIKILKKDLPPGTALLEDVAALAAGVHDSLARIVQYRLGYMSRGRLSQEAKSLAPVVLFGVSAGSGILECRPLDLADVHGYNPALLAATELVVAVNTFASTGSWPRTLPGVVRNRLGAAVGPVLDKDSQVEIDVVTDDSEVTCRIDGDIESALQEAETFSVSEPVRLVGQIFDINVKTRRLKIDAVQKRVTVPFTEEQRDTVDALRWNRAYITGYPADERLKALVQAIEIRAAAPDEEDGVVVPTELQRGEKTEAYQATAARLQEFATLEAGWNSYSAVPIHPVTAQYAQSFIRDVAGVFFDYDIEIPVPFVTPTPFGGIQFEWHREDRELELEIPTPKRFVALRVSAEGEIERAASRWEAIRLVKWVATGEEP